MQILKHAAKRSAKGKGGQKGNGGGKGNVIHTSYNRIIQIPTQSFVRLRGTQKWDYDVGNGHNLLLVLVCQLSYYQYFKSIVHTDTDTAVRLLLPELKE